MDPQKILEKFFAPESLALKIIIEHSVRVREMAVSIAEGLGHLNPDMMFIREAAMLHDIGIFMTYEPRIDCHGDKPYICHGYLGRELLEREGFPLHALVCERHIGTGISMHDIHAQGLPLPNRDMIPLSLEEKIVCYADKFFSKKPGFITTEKTVAEIRGELVRLGSEKMNLFDEMHAFFSNRPSQGTDRRQEQ